MFTLSLSVVLSIAVNVFTLGERVQEHSKCLSTLEDIQEAYLRGDYYPTDVENSVFDLDLIHIYQRGVAMTTGFYRLTYKSQDDNISHTDLDDFKKCCYPDEDNNSCVMIVILNSPLFTVLHPLLLHYFSFPRNLLSVLLNGEAPGHGTRESSFGVMCWNLPPVCDNTTSNAKRSLVYFTEQVLVLYVHTAAVFVYKTCCVNELYTYCCVYVCSCIIMYVLHILCVVHVYMYIHTYILLCNVIQWKLFLLNTNW